MTREAHLKFCKICTHQKKDLARGIVCGLSDRIADFEDKCDSHSIDQRLVTKVASKAKENILEVKTASQGKRFANYLIDQIFLIGCALFVGVGIGLLLLYVFPDYMYMLDEENKVIEYLFGFVIAMFYYSFFEGFTGRSLGKFFTRTKVVTEEGTRPDFKTIFVRSLCRHIPFNALSFLGSDTTGWHDKFSGTRVVEIE